MRSWCGGAGSCGGQARSRDPQAGRRLFRVGERAPKMIYTLIAERCSDLPVSVCCRVMKVPISGYYQRQHEPVTDREWTEAHRANTVFDIWKASLSPPAWFPVNVATRCCPVMLVAPRRGWPVSGRRGRGGGRLLSSFSTASKWCAGWTASRCPCGSSRAGVRGVLSGG
jgi:hypothetical protein